MHLLSIIQHQAHLNEEEHEPGSWVVWPIHIRQDGFMDQPTQCKRSKHGSQPHAVADLLAWSRLLWILLFGLLHQPAFNDGIIHQEP